MSTELIAISGLGVTIISVGAALAALILNGHRDLRNDMQAQRTEMQAEFKAVREDINGLRERMAHLEGLLEGLREVITGRRVAEDQGLYDPR